MNRTEQDEIQNIYMKRPHVVLLGAGASLASFPDGDRNGIKLPLMNDLIQVLELGEILESVGIDYHGRNFEEIYGSLAKDVKLQPVAQKIAARVYEHFASMRLPDEPTLYDHLVLSLRNKDLIATFNWDPFLFQALVRNHKRAEVPEAVFLHGSVAIGVCTSHKPINVGPRNKRCKCCRGPLSDSRLLYPIEEKGYAKDPFISVQWDILRKYMKNAYLFTIFGYSAPASDVEAIALLREGWGDSAQRHQEEIEIIDTKEESDLEETWSPFIFSHHYEVRKNFYESFCAKHPRRTCEAVHARLIDLLLYPDRQIPRDANFEELWEWYRPLEEVEQHNDEESD